LAVTVNVLHDFCCNLLAVVFCCQAELVVSAGHD